MKTLLLLPVLLLLGAPASAQFVYDPFSLNAAALQANKNARVHFVHKYMVEEGMAPADDSDYLSEVEYSQGGLPIQYTEREESWDNEEGWSVISLTTYLFDGPNNQLSRIRSTDNDSYDVTTAYSYDSKGNLLRKEVADIDPPTYEYGYEKGRIASCSVTQQFPEFDENDNFTGRSERVHTYQHKFSYDQKGRMAEENIYEIQDGEEVLFQRNLFDYNAQGLLSRVASYFGDEPETPSQETFYTYNEINLLKEMQEENGLWGTRSVYEFRYSFFK
ncbi:MAG: hypothetical protein IPL49_03990 [Saprospirales bacterium]|nr:hypothetical protein [Saprospirales bacterium]